MLTPNLDPSLEIAAAPKKAPKFYRSVKHSFSLMNLAPPTGLEPVTHRLEICCSIQLSYGGINKGGIISLRTTLFQAEKQMINR